ncbi:hypothetical protein [Gemmiger sp.]|uniref:hypothetical protein n=1 Tax=Gemmiger sp. TaxID=2049027 RepID=UPI003A8CE752
MKSFVCSLCHNGILGGGLYLDSQSLTYKTNKLTVDKKYRNLVLPMQEIKEISWKWIVFPIATVKKYINSLFSINHALQNGFKSILDKYKVSNSSLWGYSHFFPPIAPLLKTDGTARQYAPCGGQRAGRPTSYPRNVHT